MTDDVLYIDGAEGAYMEDDGRLLSSAEPWKAIRNYDDIANYVEITQEGLFLKDNLGTSTLKINSGSVTIGTVSGVNKGYSKYTASYAQFGNYQLRRTADGGLAFKLAEG